MVKRIKSGLNPAFYFAKGWVQSAIIVILCLLLFISAHSAVKGRDPRKATLFFVTALLATTELLGYAVLHASGDPTRLM